MTEGNYYNWHEKLKNAVPENMRIEDDLIIISNHEIIGSMAAPRKVDVTTIIITDHGSAQVIIDGKEYDLKAPCLGIILPDQTYHLVKSSEDLAFRAVVMSRRFTENLLGFYHGTSKLSNMIIECPILDISHDLVSFNTYYNMLLGKVNSRVKAFRLEGAKHLTLSMLYYYTTKLKGTLQIKDKRQQNFEKFKEDVRKFYKINRTLPFYAGRLGVSVTYLTELVKEKHGKTAAEYIDEHTAIECSALLNSTNMSINQISRSMNFPSPSVFGKFFKRMRGVSPTEYRDEK